MSSEVLEYRERKVHNGAAVSWTKSNVECNAYCKPPIHCDLWYTQSSEVDNFKTNLESYLGPKARIVNIEKAREAPYYPPEHYVGTGVVQEDFPIYSWLVFWKISE